MEDKTIKAKDKREIRKLERELNILCNEMISNIKNKKGNINIGEIRTSKSMWCELATL